MFGVLRREHQPHVEQKLFTIQYILLGTQPKHIVVGPQRKIWKIEILMYNIAIEFD
jgi:hypothetical protein